jgi:hypothetical protein
MIANPSPMNDGPMPDRYALTQNDWDVAGRVHDATILNIAGLTDNDLLDIATQHNERPDRSILPDDHSTNNLGRRMYESRRVYFGNILFEGMPHLISPSI